MGSKVGVSAGMTLRPPKGIDLYIFSCIPNTSVTFCVLNSAFSSVENRSLSILLGPLKQLEKLILRARFASAFLAKLSACGRQGATPIWDSFGAVKFE